MGGFTSDGGRVLNLQRGGEAARFEVLMLKILSQSSGGVGPCLLDWNELEEASQLGQKLNSPFAVYIQSFFHQSAWDQGNLDLAEKHLMAYMDDSESIPDGIRSIVWLDAAFFYAAAKSDLAKALDYWSRFKPSAIIPKAVVFSTEAAICTLENKSAEANSKIDLAGINNRNLKDFKVDLQHSVQLKNQLPKGVLSVAESGIYSLEDFQFLKEKGFDGFLMGEYFMKNTDPAKAFEEFSLQINS